VTITLALFIALVCFLVGFFAAGMLQGRIVEDSPQIEQGVDEGSGS